MQMLYIFLYQIIITLCLATQYKYIIKSGKITSYNNLQQPCFSQYVSSRFESQLTGEK